jgi:hypothetical protein
MNLSLFKVKIEIIYDNLFSWLGIKQGYVAILLVTVSIFSSVNAADSEDASSTTDAKKAPSVGDLAKASQNPVASMISVPFENNATFNNGANDVFVNVLNVKPVIPMGISENWNLINRAIIPIVYQDSGFTGQTYVGGATINGGTTVFISPVQQQGSLFGLGDIVYQGFISPKKSGKFIWGLGPQLNIPTGMDRLSSNQWSLGPAAVGLTMPGNWVIGTLISNVWSIGGYDNAKRVNNMTRPYSTLSITI